MSVGDMFSRGGYEAEKWSDGTMSANSRSASVNCQPSFSALWAFDHTNYTDYGACVKHKKKELSCGIRVSTAFAEAGCPLDFAGSGSTCLLADGKTACGIGAEQVYNVVRRRYKGEDTKVIDLIKSGTSIDKGLPKSSTGIVLFKIMDYGGDHVDFWDGTDLWNATSQWNDYYQQSESVYFFGIK